MAPSLLPSVLYLSVYSVLAACSFANTIPPTTFAVKHLSSFMSSEEYNSYISTSLAPDTVMLNPKYALPGKPVRTPLFAKPGGIYVVEVIVSQEHLVQHLLLDTGSSFIWWQCAPCQECFRQQDQLYNYKNSTSFRAIDCKSKDCDKAKEFIIGCAHSFRNLCFYQKAYLDGSRSQGMLGADVLYNALLEHITEIKFGCAQLNRGLYRGFYAGIMGFGRGPFSFPSQIGASQFSFCLPEPNSKKSSPLFFGGIPPLNHDGKKIIVPMFQNENEDGPNHHYYVQFSGISIEGEMVPIDPKVWETDSYGNNGVIIDSGTTVTRLQQKQYAIFRDRFRQAASRYLPLTPIAFGILDTCYRIPANSTYQIPEITFHFAGNATKLELTREQIMWRIVNGAVYCLAFAPVNEYVTIIGSTQLQTIRLSFDLSKKTIRFSPNYC